MSIPGFSLLAFLLVALVIDLRSQTIPNWLSLGGALAAFLFSLFLPAYSPDPSDSILGWITGFFLLFPVFMLHKIGAGDIKLLAMAGAFMGPVAIFWGALFSLIAGGVVACVWIIGSRFFLAFRFAPLAWESVGENPDVRSDGPKSASNQIPGLSNNPRRMPYAAAIAIGCTMAFLGFWYHPNL